MQKLPLPHPNNLQLYVDFFYVNQQPFLHTKSSKINFLTVQSGENRTTNSIISGLKKVVNVYEKRGFTITNLHTDNKFDIEDVKDSLQPINTHIHGRKEHVGTIERSVRSVKDRRRALCHALLYQRYTKLMVHSLVKNAIFWMNAFPSANDARQHLSPSSMVLGGGKPNFSKPHIAFGSYDVVYNTTKNNMTQRNIPTIALKPSNEHRGSYFMSLLSGKKLHSYQWKEMPIPNKVIDCVHHLAKEQKQPYLHDGVPIFEWGDGEIIRDDAEYANKAPELDLNETGDNESQEFEEQVGKDHPYKTT